MVATITVSGNSANAALPPPAELKARLRDAGCDVVLLLGPGPHPSQIASSEVLTLVELDRECLGVHTGERMGEEGGNVVGFARFRIGTGDPSELVELVVQPATPAAAIEAARRVFELLGLRTSVCRDFPGRILDRLMRPYFNAALASLDESLASAADIDLTVELGLGYPCGPIALLEGTGLADHARVCHALHQQLGEAAFVPARRALVAGSRAGVDV